MQQVGFFFFKFFSFFFFTWTWLDVAPRKLGGVSWARPALVGRRWTVTETDPCAFAYTTGG